jgi:SpoVK/Ycf46/Vps4 family AAA+-type ATPase
LEILHNLLRVRYIKNSLLVKSLGLSEDEATLLKYLVNNFIKGENSVSVERALSELFHTTSLKTKLDKLSIINSLKEREFVDTGSMGGIFVFETVSKHEKNRIPNLELLQASISLTSKFLFLLEKDADSLKQDDLKANLEITPYTNSFQYMEDKFKKISLYLERDLKSEDREERLQKINKFIDKRVDKSAITIPLHKFLEESQFSQNEEMILLAVLSEEYAVPFQKNFRNIENLIDLISFSTIDRFENRTIFRERSKLIKAKIFDFETSIHIVNEQKSFTNEELYITEEFLNRIEGHEKEEREEDKNLLKELVKKQELFQLVEPKKGLDEVVLSEETKKILQTIIKQLDKNVLDKLVKWGIKERAGLDARIIFYGVAGTGKTLTATAFAKSLDKEILHFDCSKILSMYVGESEKNVRNIFDTYRDLVKKSGSEPILFLNEADQFLTSRSTDTSSSTSQMYNQMQNIFLEQIENFEGILIATTNLLDNLDKAFSRRFNYKVEFKLPTKEQREDIWKSHLPKNADFKDEFSLERLSEFKLSGGQIDLIIKNTAYRVATRDDSIFSTEDFIKEIEREKLSSFDGNRVMGFLK